MAGLTAALALLTAVSIAGADSGAGSGAHRDDGRFTAYEHGFPPQPRDMTDVARLPRQRASSNYGSSVAGTVAAVMSAAVEDSRVTALLQDGWLDHGAIESASAGGGWQARLGLPDGDTVLVDTVADGVGRHRVVDVHVVAATEWQPPLVASERLRAIALAREALVAEGNHRADQLTGFAIHGLESDGGWHDARVAYVTFHASQDSPPEFSAVVDLTAQHVDSTAEQAPPTTPVTQPRGRQPQAGAEVGQTTIPLRDTISWRGWNFTYELSHRTDGVSLRDGSLRGVEVFNRLSMPVMTVYYRPPEDTPPSEHCGPFADRLGLPELTPVDWFDDELVVLREFTQRGVDWLEIGILDTLGNYVLYQSWFVSEDGQIDGHAFAKGLQCMFFHEHYPFWRLDVDLAGADNDRVTRVVDGQVETLVEEFDAPATAADDHRWSVVDTVTGDRVDLMFDDGTWTVPGQVVAETTYANNRVYGRVATTDGDGEWRTPATPDVPHNDGESLDADVAVWYRGYLPHAVEEGGELWHSTGVRMDFTIVPRHHSRPRAGGVTE